MYKVTSEVKETQTWLSQALLWPILSELSYIFREVINIRGKAIIDFDIEFDFKSQLLESRKQGIKKIIFKVCRRCGEKKPILKFSTDKHIKSGINNLCKNCNSLASSSCYYLNREDRLAVVKQYDKEHKDQRRVYSIGYREDHKEHLKKEAEKYYRKNRKRIKAKSIKYYREVILNNGKSKGGIFRGNKIFLPGEIEE